MKLNENKFFMRSLHDVFVKTESVYGSSVCPHSTEDGTSDLNEI
jgi:hypothetical protein